MADSALFYFDNLTEKGTLTVTSEDSDFPKENLQDRDQHSFWKPGNATSPQIITVDLGSAMTARAMLLVHENLYTKSIGLKLIVDASDSPLFTNPVYLVGSAGSYEAPTSDDEPLWYERFSINWTKRFWRFMLNTGGDTDVLVADAYLFPELDTERHPGGAWKLTRNDPGTKVVRGPGSMYSTSTHVPTHSYTLSFRSILKTLWDELEAGHDICRTGFLPFLYIDEYDVLRLVRFASAPSMDHQFGPYVNGGVALEDDY